MQTIFRMSVPNSVAKVFSQLLPYKHNNCYLDNSHFLNRDKIVLFEFES